MTGKILIVALCAAVGTFVGFVRAEQLVRHDYVGTHIGNRRLERAFFVRAAHHVGAPSHVERVCGSGVVSDGRILAVKDYSSVNIRVPHEVTSQTKSGLSRVCITFASSSDTSL